MSTDPYNVKGNLNKLPLADAVDVLDGPVEASPEARGKHPFSVGGGPVHGGQGPRISDETRAGVERLEAALRKQKEEEAEALKHVEAERSDSGETRIDLGDTPEEVREQFDTVFYRGTAIDNPRTRAAIEKRCTEMNFDSLILTGRVNQGIEILKGKLFVEFQSLTSADLLWIDNQRDLKWPNPDTQEEKYAASTWTGYAKLTLSLKNVNGRAYASCFHKDGGIDAKVFDESYRAVVEHSDKLNEVLFVNLTWFEDRVGKMFDPQMEFEQLKNG